MAKNSNLSDDDIAEATALMTTAGHTPSGNVVSAYKMGNTRVIIRDTYMDDKNIKGFEQALQRCYPYTQITIARR